MKTRLLLLLLGMSLNSILSFGQENITPEYITEIRNFQEQLNHHYTDSKKSPLSEEDRHRFKGHDFYPINKNFRVVARLDKSEQNKKIKFKTSTSRKAEYKIYARAIFTIDGREMGLNIYRNAKMLEKNPLDNMAFLPFNDETNGVETYGGGRYLDIDLDLDKETVIIDFNKSYNPYCAYSDGYSCPVPPKENNLDILIEAGIRLSSHYPDEEGEDKKTALRLSIDQANDLAELPLACLQQEYPNKLGQTLGKAGDIGEPHVLHPAFYGCFDWHSAVHGHWSLVKLLKDFPKLNKAEIIRSKLKQNISEKNIQEELAYFKGNYNLSYERTYGWAWLLKLAEELHNWDDPLAKELENNLRPLVDLVIRRYIEFLPKLNYPVRVGEHTNTAFGLAFAWDYADLTEHFELKTAIESRAKEFYWLDKNCPLDWEPSGYDFLSPCFEEIDLMRRVLNKSDFKEWISAFAPEVVLSDFKISVGYVLDRTDGKLVHLDGLNFSRAWVMYGLADQYPEFDHLIDVANEHVTHSIGNLIHDEYEGGHWLGSFAIFALGR